MEIYYTLITWTLHCICPVRGQDVKLFSCIALSDRPDCVASAQQS